MTRGGSIREQAIADQAGQISLFDDTSTLRSPERVDELPATAQRLVEVIGLQPTIDLVKFFGGDELEFTTIQVAGSSRLWELLVEVVGVEAATQLVRAFGGSRSVYIPKCTAALLAQRNRQIVAAYDGGEDFDRIRRRFGLTRRHLWRLLKSGS